MKKVILALIITVMLCACGSQRNGCPSHRKMSGYGSIDPHEYQLELEMDSVYIYDSNRLVAVLPYGNHGIDSVL